MFHVTSTFLSFTPRVRKLWLGLAPAGILGALVVLFSIQGWDRELAGFWFHLEGNQWLLRHAWVTDTLLHQGVRKLNILAILIMVAVLLISRYQHRWRCYNATLLLLLSIIVSVTIVALLKHLTNRDCPWSLLQYAGQYKDYGLFGFKPAYAHQGQCFPAGHASIGYSWLAIYPWLLTLRPRYARWGIIIPTAIGILLGFSQQLRGAHFITDDFTTAALCWLITMSLYFLRKDFFQNDVS